MKISKPFVVRLDKKTEERLERVAKEFGVSKAGCVRLLINDEFRFFNEQDLWNRKPLIKEMK